MVFMTISRIILSAEELLRQNKVGQIGILGRKWHLRGGGGGGGGGFKTPCIKIVNGNLKQTNKQNDSTVIHFRSPTLTTFR